MSHDVIDPVPVGRDGSRDIRRAFSCGIVRLEAGWQQAGGRGGAATGRRLRGSRLVDIAHDGPRAAIGIQRGTKAGLFGLTNEWRLVGPGKDWPRDGMI